MIRTVYLAGPYSGDEEHNTKVAIALADMASNYGFIPFIPHLFHFWNEQHPHDYEFWMRMDEMWISKCDALLYYEMSPGADRDVAVASRLGKPIFNSLAELIQYTKR